MRDFKIAFQLYSVRGDVLDDFEGTLKKVKAMGYDGVEFGGYFGKGAAETKALCERIGLVPIAAHVSYAAAREDSQLFDIYAQIGCRYVVVPFVAAEYRPGTEGFSTFIEDIKRFGAKANRLGMQFGYHNHRFEFVKVEGKYGLDRLLEEVPADLLTMEFDTCWVDVAGEDPAEYIRKYGDRVEIIHLKDYIGTERGNLDDLGDSFDYRPLGMGVCDLPATLKALDEVGAEWLIVEQDNPSKGKTALECAQLSIDYLKSIL